MANVELVKKLRAATMAGLADCKKALDEANDDFDEAIKVLQKKGLAASNARSGRATAEGRVFIKDNGKDAVNVAVIKCETDFVANNKDFAALGDAENLTEAVDKLKVSMRENIIIDTEKSFDYGPEDVVGTYVHSDNKSGAVVILSNVKDREKAKTFAHDCCLHLVAFEPPFINKESVPQDYLDEKMEIFKAQMDKDPKMAGKPDKVKEGILNGKINKHLAEVCFLEQPFVKDDKRSVKKVLEDECGKDAVIGFKYFSI